MKQKIHFIQIIPFILLIVLSAWHLYSWHYYSGVGNVFQQAGFVTIAVIMAALAFTPRKSENATVDYVLNMLEPMRPHFIGATCFIIGGAHFISLVRSEPVFLQMGFMVIILAYFETAGMAERFFRVYSGDRALITENTLRRLAVKQLGMLAMVFVLSVMLLYLGLMAVVGFRETWSVALLAAVMILALVFMTRVRQM